ncbi:hypothetical protein ABT354_23030 [Streptomyces sp. NPDC000594]|uniref:hypothetical protein n=1 Tax=Streptomyces sp. NPDC000594 TaxID=3154261 RepID=UPI003323A13E
MRRTLTTLGTLTAALALAVAVPQSASAANGVLIVNGTAHENPSGCISPAKPPLTVDNWTDTGVYVFEEANCQGWPIGIVHPGLERQFPQGRSVLVF